MQPIDFNSSEQSRRLPMDRRTFLQLAGWSLMSAGFVACSAPQPLSPPAAAEEAASTTSEPDLELALTAAPATAAILPGAETNVWRYTGEVLQGDPAALQTLEGSYLGPILRLRQGQRVRIHFINDLPEASIIHWHGLIVPEEMDGHPRYAVEPGERYVYDFTVNNRAGTYWYHPHPHGRTGPQVWMGLVGLLIVSDEEEAALDLPDGDYDLPLVIQDRQFDDQQQFVYGGAAMGGGMMGGMNHGGMGGMMGGSSAAGGVDMMTSMMGQLGDRILVNGQADFQASVATRAYRLRLLNGSNSRIYKLAWDDGTPLTVIGADGGLLERPVEKPYITLAPAQRADLWVDFSQDAPGVQRQLVSLAFSGVEMGGMMETNPLHQGAPFPVMTVQVDRQEAETRTLPERLATPAALDPAQATNADAPRQFELYMQNMLWTINGREFEMDAVAQDEEVTLNQPMLWEFVNLPGRGMMADFMAHPMHIHGVHFQVIDRQVDPAYSEGWDSLYEGQVDEGLRDTVLVMPGERVRLLMQFTEPGLFLYHCHLLEHEDLSMMRNFRVNA
ncbi:MAG: multicopper oxidase domain-containing protein [Caldilineaceae bacterium]|nr:multicopper oxidase domain-containing protein [Caldilineaceae bacterium]